MSWLRWLTASSLCLLPALWPLGCEAGGQAAITVGGGHQGGAGHGGSPGGAAGSGGAGGEGGLIQPCIAGCRDDLHAVVDCNGAVVDFCGDGEGCDLVSAECINACAAAESSKRSIGCEYYAVQMDQLDPSACFAAFVANTWNEPAHITVERGGQALPVETFTYLPAGFGPTLNYGPYDPVMGLLPGEVAVVFLAGEQGTPGVGSPVCPLASAVPGGAQVAGTGRGDAFRIQSDVPVVAYQMSPYGGGSAAVTGASLLLPTSAWDDSYLAIHAYDSGPHPTSLDIVAREDDTVVTLLPTANIAGGGGLPPGSANDDYVVTLAAGEYLQLTQAAELTGTPVTASKPIGFLAGARCSYVPAGVYACDHLEQMIPPLGALGHHYVGVSHAPRSGEPAIWRLLGAVDGTALTWSNDIGGPATLDRGELVEITTHFPFVVSSQDPEHPFLLMAHMSGGDTNGMMGAGDADAVLAVPPAQFLRSYVFFTDPTYPVTNLVVVRAQKDGAFEDVTLECAGVLQGWQPVGEHEYTRVSLGTGDFEPVGGCSAGRHAMQSEAPFGVWVWGWGTPQTTAFTSYVSYGYPAGMNVQRINNVALR
jgi:hypothetical protein